MKQTHKLDGVIGYVGIEILLVNEGVKFDNFLVADSESDATNERNRIQLAQIE